MLSGNFASEQPQKCKTQKTHMLGLVLNEDKVLISFFNFPVSLNIVLRPSTKLPKIDC